MSACPPGCCMNCNLSCRSPAIMTCIKAIINHSRKGRWFMLLMLKLESENHCHKGLYDRHNNNDEEIIDHFLIFMNISSSVIAYDFSCSET